MGPPKACAQPRTCTITCSPSILSFCLASTATAVIPAVLCQTRNTKKCEKRERGLTKLIRCPVAISRDVLFGVMVGCVCCVCCVFSAACPLPCLNFECPSCISAFYIIIRVAIFLHHFKRKTNDMIFLEYSMVLQLCCSCK